MEAQFRAPADYNRIRQFPPGPFDGTSMLRQTFLAAVALLAFFANASLLIAQPAGERPSGAASVPLSPADALKTFHLPDELRIELVAAEPEVVDPVAIRFDEQGRLWVAEMRDYPTGPTPDGKQQSRIRLLEDRDGDGRYEKASIFADGRSFVTGLASGPDGNLYLSQLMDNPEGAPVGTIFRILPDQTVEPVVEGLVMPLGIVFDGDGNLYVTVNSIISGPDAPLGQVLRFDGIAG